MQVTVEQLEEIAGASHNFKNIYSDATTDHFTPLGEFIRSLGVDLQARFDYIKRAFVEPPFVIGDLGGGEGGMIAPLNDVPEIEAFVIDRHLRIPLNNPLPEERYISVEAENMESIPDNSFHYLMSYNAFGYMDHQRTLCESFRILKPGGVLDFDWEFPRDSELAGICAMDIGKHVEIEQRTICYRISAVKPLE